MAAGLACPCGDEGWAAGAAIEAVNRTVHVHVVEASEQSHIGQMNKRVLGYLQTLDTVALPLNLYVAH